jgi:hypothetical protein
MNFPRRVTLPTPEPAHLAQSSVDGIFKSFSRQPRKQANIRTRKRAPNTPNTAFAFPLNRLDNLSNSYSSSIQAKLRSY